MRYRKLTANGDYSFGNSELDFYTNTPEAVGQSVQTRLLLWLGEWFLNVDEGTAWVEGILGKRTKEEADATIQDRVLATTGVTGISNYASVFNGDTRYFRVTFDIDTIYGPTTVEVQNSANF